MSHTMDTTELWKIPKSEVWIAKCEVRSLKSEDTSRFPYIYDTNWVLFYVRINKEFGIVMFVTISAWKRYSVCFYLQLFVGWLMSYLCYLCLFPYSCVQYILCCVFIYVFLRLV
jgi:hypothetical protein